MRKVIVFKLFILNFVMIFAQQNPIQNYFIFNQTYINPAYVGTKQWTQIGFNTTHQWIGLEGAPSSQLLSMEGAITSKNGLGFYLLSDRIGAQSQQAFMLNFSHMIKISEKWKLSMGLASGLSYNAIDGTKTVIDTENDPAIPKLKTGALLFDSKTGLFAFSNKTFFGISMANLYTNFITQDFPVGIKENPHLYLTAGHIININDNVYLKPGIIIREDFKSQTNVDVNAFLLFKNIVWFGSSYRFGVISPFNQKIKELKPQNALAMFLNWNVQNTITVGYAYTYSLSKFSQFSGHEIQLSYQLPKKSESQLVSPRYF